VTDFGSLGIDGIAAIGPDAGTRDSDDPWGIREKATP
jgi:hypothetical protein